MTTRIKCVVWDLDGTVWPGVAIESSGPRPVPFPEALHAMDLLERRGLVNSVASRTDPVVREVLRADPRLGERFVAPQLGWGHKSDMIRTIATELGIGTSAVALVDDNPFERAEVSAVLPDVLVLSPAEFHAQLDSPAFRPAVLTADAAHRVERYRQEQRRQAAARAFGGSSEDFLHACDVRLRVSRAAVADIDRVAELIERTHRFNTTGEAWTAEQVRAMITDPSWFVPVARMTDRYGDYGLIGAALVARGRPTRTSGADPAAGLAVDPAADLRADPALGPDAAWRLRLFSVSCRAAGRNIPTALLGWLLGTARRAGVGSLLVDLRPSDANLELRVLLRGAGFTADPGQPAAGPGTPLVLRRDTAADLPAVPWLTIDDETGRNGVDEDD